MTVSVTFSPVFNTANQQDADGNPANGFNLFQYDAGSFNDLKATYTDSTGTVQNENPIVLDSSGTIPTALWLVNGEAYNLVLSEVDGTTVVKSFDNVTGVPLPVTSGGGDSAAIWVLYAGGTFLNANSFVVTGNQTVAFKKGNRVRLTLAGGFTYGLVSSVAFSTPNTTVTIINDGPVIDSSLSAAEASILIGANGETVDAGGVSYFDSYTYSISNTVGNKLQSLQATATTNNNTLTTAINTLQEVWETTGSSTVYTISPTTPTTSYSTTQIWTVQFHTANAGACTLAVSGLAATSLKQFAADGTLVDPSITTGMVTDVIFNTPFMIILDQLPVATVTPPHGQTILTTNGMSPFVVPDNVFSIKVTAIGGGGGGGAAFTDGMGDNGNGGTGGFGGAGIGYITTTPGTSYAISIGAGGTGGDGTLITNGTAGGSTTFGSTVVQGTGGGGGIAGIFDGNGANGANGHTGAGDYGPNGIGYTVGSSLKAWGGAGGTGSSTFGVAGSPGIIVVEW